MVVPPMSGRNTVRNIALVMASSHSRDASSQRSVNRLSETGCDRNARWNGRYTVTIPALSVADERFEIAMHEDTCAAKSFGLSASLHK